MHCLKGIYIKKRETEKEDGQEYFPVKMVISQKKARVFYFKDKKQQNAWFKGLCKAAGCANVLDFYDFLSELASGNQGVVYKAKNKKSGMKVAIKAIKKKDMTEDQVALQRMEIEAMKMCQNENIMKLLDLFEDDRYFYLVLELLNGGDLFDYLEKRNFHISEGRAKELFKQISSAVAYIHQFGIVHRDLKIENIIMSDNSE